MELVYGDSHVKASSSLSCRQMNDFLDLMKKTVWKIGVSRNSVKERTTDFCNGVCISSDGLILTHSFNKIDLVSICLHSPDNVEYSDVQIVKHEISSGLALLRPTQQKSYDHIRFGEETGFYVGQNLYAILYPKESTDPIILMGYVAYDCDPESKFITDVCPTRKTIKELDSDECAFPVGLGEDVPLLQIGHLGASDEFRQELGRYARKNFYGLAEGRGCPVFETTGNLVGVVVFQQSKYDFAIHIDEVKKFVSDALDPSTQYGGEKEKRKKKSKGPLSS